jgi:hypothetical protein
MTSEVRDPLARQQLVYVHVGDLERRRGDAETIEVA